MTPTNNLTIDVLHHCPHWAIEEAAARQIWRILQSTDATAHRAEFQAARGQGYSEADPYEVRNGVAVIPISGPMTKQPTSFSGGCSTVMTRRAIRQAVSDEDVKAIVLAIDSPGGSVAGTGDLAADVLAATKSKPCYAFVEDSCCSAAYWVASQCTKIFANATAIVGSIGTYMVLDDQSRRYENAGINVHVISTGKYKGAGVEGAKITDEQLAEYQRTVNDLNSHFLAAVASGRRMKRSAVEAVADGRVHVGQEAMNLGLIDGLSSFDDLIISLARGGKRPCAIKSDFATETEPLIGSTLEQALDSALIAVEGIAERLAEVKDLRESQGRCFSPERLQQAQGLSERLTQVVSECAALSSETRQVDDLMARLSESIELAELSMATN